MTAVSAQIEALVTSGNLALALGLSLVAGLLSFLSPCVLPLLPGYLGFLGGLAGQGGDHAPRGRIVLGVALFVVGFSAVFITLGVLSGVLGAALREHRDVLRVVLGALTIGLGLTFAGWTPLSGKEARLHHRPAAGLAGAPVLGVVFGLGWTPCIGPTLGAVLTLGATGGSPGRAGLLAVAYCVGLGVPFLLAAVGARSLVGRLSWFRRHGAAVTRVGGAALVVLGVLLVTGLWDRALAATRPFVAGFDVVL